MKKLVALLVVIGLVFAGFITYVNYEKPAENEAAVIESDSAAEAVTAPQTIDFDAIYALHEPDEIVMSIAGKDVTWAEYFYMLYSNANSIASQISYYQMYGMDVGWDSPLSDDPADTFAAYAVSSVDSLLKHSRSIMLCAEDNNVELSQESLDSMQEQLETEIVSLCGEGATEEQFNDFLKGIYLTRDMYDEMRMINAYYRENFLVLYGLDGELVSDEDAVGYLEDNAYMRADHILFMTVDTSYQPLEESVVAEKKALAEQAAAELAAIEDEDERIARFYELKEEYTEDTGASVYPEGYVFTPGTMVSSFEEGHNSLADNEISGVIESEYGYHILLRLPLDPDAVIEYSSEGTPLTARSMYADSAYEQLIFDYTDKLEAVYAEGFEKPNLIDYLV